MQEWFQSHLGYVLGALGILSVAMFFISLIALPIVISRLSKDHFISKNSPQESRTVRSLLVQIIRNILGFILLLGGIVMLVLPGQGVLTILIGAFLMDVPGIRALKTRLLGRSRVRIGLNWLRFRCGKPPLNWPAT